MIKDRVHVLLLLFFVGMALQLRAQMGMGKIEEIEAVQARKLIVMVEEPREKMLKKIAKKPKRGSVDDYKADLISYNANVREVVEKFWPYNKNDIQYKTFDEIETLRKTRTKDYAVLACLSAEASSFSSGYNYAEGLHWVKDIKDDFEDRSDGMFSVMLLNTIEDFGKRPVYFTPLFDVFPTKASLVYGIKTAVNYFNVRVQTKTKGVSMREEQARQEEQMARRAPMLADKTLLIRVEWLDKELTEAVIEKLYPHKYMICDREFMDNVVMNQDGNYAYGVVLPYVVSTSNRNSVMYFQFVMDGADSQTMCLVRPSTGSMMLAGSLTGKAGNRNFTIKVLEKIVEQVQGRQK